MSNRLAAGLAISIVAGLSIAYLDSRPGWDDTGVTVAALFIGAAVAAFVAGRLPWLVAIATGIWVPLFELPALATGGPPAALLFAGAGAAAGWLVGRGQR